MKLNLKQIISGRLEGGSFSEHELLSKVDKALDGKPFICIVCRQSEDLKKLETAIVSNFSDREQGSAILKTVYENHDDIVSNIFHD